MNDYYQGEPRGVIQQHIKSDWQDRWIAWNWRTATWDDIPGALDACGNKKEIQHDPSRNF